MIYALIFINLITLSEERLLYDANNKDDIIKSDEDGELNQALLLIDILKSDRLQVLQQAAENITVVEQPSFAATTGLSNEMSSSKRAHNKTIGTLATTMAFRDDYKAHLFNKSEGSWNSPTVHVRPLFPPRWSDQKTMRVYNGAIPFYDTRRLPQQRLRPRLRPWRRYFPDYYLYDVRPRRYYHNLPTNKRLRTQAPTTTTAVYSTAITGGPRKRPTNTKRIILSSTTSKSLLTKSRPLATNTTRRNSKHILHKKTSKYINKDPVAAEIASELLKEFRLINVTPKATKGKTSITEDTSTE